MPPKPTAPASSVSQTCGTLKAASSRRPLAPASPGHDGTNQATSASGEHRQAAGGPEGRAPAELLAEHAWRRVRRPRWRPRGRASPGQPRGPCARAGPCSPRRGRRRRSRRRAAARRRSARPSAARSDVARALSALPTAKAAISATSRPRRGSRAPRKASTGAPTTTPTAYAEMTWPAVGIETSTPSAICGSRPIVTNSVVPIAKPPIASARTARPKWRAVTDGTSRSSTGAARSLGWSSSSLPARQDPRGRIPRRVLAVTWVAVISRAWPGPR